MPEAICTIYPFQGKTEEKLLTKKMVDKLITVLPSLYKIYTTHIIYSPNQYSESFALQLKKQLETYFDLLKSNKSNIIK